ncbi:unnamed protein product [Pieris macdunnoughi]|uniref:Uncharacterized protein n=1 Tax=Pieris macdunnoughi TaxID=345717 RepID=A0A821Y9Y3_9NEOP|nr:unnamed protein product [Pieris macdunnoughi]
MENDNLIDSEYHQINQLYDECLGYLKDYKDLNESEDPDYESIKEKNTFNDLNCKTREHLNEIYDTDEPKIGFNVINELKSNESINSILGETKSERLRRLSKQLPKIIITHSNSSLEQREKVNHFVPIKSGFKTPPSKRRSEPSFRKRHCEYPKRLVSKDGVENIALISNVPFGKIRLLNDTFHTLINLRWRWIVMGTVCIHFAIWLVFAVFWYISALAHYDFEPEPPQRLCVTGGKDFVTIFLASVEAQTTIGFGDRAIDEECPESIFLFVMQLILGTGLSGVLTCVVYAKLTRPEKLSRDGVGFSKKAVISMRDGRLCLMIRAWDLNYDHIICSEFTAHYIHTRRTKEGEVVRYYAESLKLQQRQFLLWPVTLLHVIDADSPLYTFTPQHFTDNSYEITVSLKGASASMGTYTQSQSSYLPREVVWGKRFPSVVRYNTKKQKYVIDHNKLDTMEPVDTPYCSAYDLDNSRPSSRSKSHRPGTPGSFSEKVSSFELQRSSSFRSNKKL